METCDNSSSIHEQNRFYLLFAVAPTGGQVSGVSSNWSRVFPKIGGIGLPSVVFARKSYMVIFHD